MTSKIEERYLIDGILLIQLERNIASIIKSDTIQTSEEQSDDTVPIMELCAYYTLMCRNCKQDIGIFYITTTEAYEQIRMKFLIFEQSVQCQDADTCEYIDLNLLFQNSVIQIPLKKDNMNQQQSYNRSKIHLLKRNNEDAQYKRGSRSSSFSSQIKVKKEQDSQEDNLNESIHKIQQTQKQFEEALNVFDERISNSETQFEYLNYQIHKLISKSSENKSQGVYSEYNSNNKQYSTPKINIKQLEGFSQSGGYYSGNSSYGYKQEDYD